MKNSHDTIGNRTRDLPACGAVSEPTVPPRTPTVTTRGSNNAVGLAMWVCLRSWCFRSLRSLLWSIQWFTKHLRSTSRTVHACLREDPTGCTALQRDKQSRSEPISFADRLAGRHTTNPLQLFPCPNPYKTRIRYVCMYEGWNFNSGNYLFTTDTK